MKTSKKAVSGIILSVMVCAFAVGNPVVAQEVTTNPRRATSELSARLIVNRAANFGTTESLDLRVDGQLVAAVAYNDTYDAPIPPGKHVLSINTSPKTYAQHPKPVTITVQPGKTYSFTAVWANAERAALIAD
jgi:hypothetical protein